MLLTSVGSVIDPMLLKHLPDQLADLIRCALSGDGGQYSPFAIVSQEGTGLLLVDLQPCLDGFPGVIRPVSLQKPFYQDLSLDLDFQDQVEMGLSLLE